MSEWRSSCAIECTILQKENYITIRGMWIRLSYQNRWFLFTSVALQPKIHSSVSILIASTLSIWNFKDKHMNIKEHIKERHLFFICKTNRMMTGIILCGMVRTWWLGWFINRIICTRVRFRPYLNCSVKTRRESSTQSPMSSGFGMRIMSSLVFGSSTSCCWT